MKNNQFAVQQLFDDSKLACILAGQDTETSDMAKAQQLSYIVSEVKELADALEQSDLVEQLDACNDILVTTFGYMLKLEQQGALLNKSMLKTGANNLTKFPTSKEVAEKTVEFYLQTKNKECTINFNAEHGKFVVRDKNGKYLKPFGFVENNLSDCFMKELVEQ